MALYLFRMNFLFSYYHSVACDRGMAYRLLSTLRILINIFVSMVIFIFMYFFFLSPNRFFFPTLFYSLYYCELVDTLEAYFVIETTKHTIFDMKMNFRKTRKTIANGSYYIYISLSQFTTEYTKHTYTQYTY